MHDFLHFLASERPQDGHFHNWQFAQISGSANNLLYRAISSTADLVIKFTIRDARRRAYREYQALLALQQAEANLAPQPIQPQLHPPSRQLALCRSGEQRLG